ncbi:hypothetical protein CHS0354_013637 [Potamilus streckersoni]|uniref:PDZ domain-containing protein n=1 Tax=Potamilus streckersoni TaxID=2493646 RepID=A0AAE0SLH7_9BIVA|nr:hypothetical protein CHS0354_013637 [Potamilus streckersoni]
MILLYFEWIHSASLPPVIPAINKDINVTEQLKMTVHRGRGGFGFTVVESCPVKVGRVDRDSHAAETGLREDDVIIQVNGVNVSRSTSTSVAKLVKSSGSKVSLELIRHTSVFLESLPSKRRPRRYQCDKEESGHVSAPNADLTKPLLRDSGYVSPRIVKFWTRLKSSSRLSLDLQ